MANYREVCKTNYFRVTDEDEYEKLFGLLTAEDTIHDLTETDNNGNVWHAFGCFGTIDYHHKIYDNNGNLVVDKHDFYVWVNMLQKILKDAFIFYDRRRYTPVTDVKEKRCE